MKIPRNTGLQPLETRGMHLVQPQQNIDAGRWTNMKHTVSESVILRSTIVRFRSLLALCCFLLLPVFSNAAKSRSTLLGKKLEG